MDSRAGFISWHGGHQVAVKSTATGSRDSSTSFCQLNSCSNFPAGRFGGGVSFADSLQPGKNTAAVISASMTLNFIREIPSSKQDEGEPPRVSERVQHH